MLEKFKLLDSSGGETNYTLHRTDDENESIFWSNYGEWYSDLYEDGLLIDTTIGERENEMLRHYNLTLGDQIVDEKAEDSRQLTLDL